ncbi:unnamed protein product [Periconia digitata]|uniref:Uncharacterized protein n=1 Tax=Periconia digitata TaxID=1303443 RepID=A0A9W4UWZ1_9PLEO|nr:unnamed protein product [Periconia digitata]
MFLVFLRHYLCAQKLPEVIAMAASYELNQASRTTKVSRACLFVLARIETGHSAHGQEFGGTSCQYSCPEAVGHYAENVNEIVILFVGNIE